MSARTKISKRKSKRSERMIGGLTVERSPPKLDVTPKASHTFRYVANSNFTGTLNSSVLMLCPGMVCTVANNTVVSIAATMRIRRISVYPAGGTTASITWYDNTRAQDVEWNQDQPLGTTLPTVITSTPPPNTLCGQWYNTTLNANICGLIVKAGSVIDVTLEWTTVNSYGNFFGGIATGTLGVMYYSYLDGASTHSMPPVGLPTTF